jgi:enoyl-[acyl-carrier protein] reductase I
MIPAFKDKLLEGKKGLIVGIANEQSIACIYAKAFHALGSETVTYLNDKAKKYTRALLIYEKNSGPPWTPARRI